MGNPQEKIMIPATRNLLGVYSYDVNLDFFSGPMDLLLHLVHRQEVPVAEVEMTVICEQYLQIVLKTANEDLERATEFLVIAATLLAIKSKALLPVEENPDDDVHDLGYDIRFFENLRNRLIAYETCQQRAVALRELPQHGVDTFSRNDRRNLIPTAEMIAEEEESINSLSLAFMGLLKRIGATKKFFTIQLESVSVVNYMMRMVDKLKKSTNNSYLSFVREFSKADNSNSTNKGIIIGSFIAVLELAKRGVLKAEQDGESIDFKLSYCLRKNDEIGELFSEFDEDLARESDKVVKLADYANDKSKSTTINQKDEVNSE